MARRVELEPGAFFGAAGQTFRKQSKSTTVHGVCFKPTAHFIEVAGEAGVCDHE
jgi:hypothetical protein